MTTPINGECDMETNGVKLLRKIDELRTNYFQKINKENKEKEEM